MDGSQKEGGNFLNLLQKKGDTQKGGGERVPKRRGSNRGGNYGKMYEWLRKKLLKSRWVDFRIAYNKQRNCFKFLKNQERIIQQSGLSEDYTKALDPITLVKNG